MRQLAFLTVALSIALGGCTSLNVHKFGSEESSRQGIAYFLPFTQFETKLTWTASCDANNGNEFKLTPKAEMTPKTGPDPDGLYVIDYQSLDAFTKTSDVKVEFYENGAIKSINASADDNTGEILSTTLTAVGKFTRAIAFGDADGRDEPVQLVCKDELVQAIQNAREAKSGKMDANGTIVEEGVDQKTARLKTATEELAAYSALITRAGVSVTDAQKAEHFRRVAAVTAAQIELDIATKNLANAMKAITFTEAINFPSSSSITESDKGEMIDIGVLSKWIVNDPAKFCANDDQDCIGAGLLPSFNSVLEDLAQKNSLWLQLQANTDFAERFQGGDSGDSANGVRYRIAVPATLTICKEKSCSDWSPPEEDTGGDNIPGDELSDDEDGIVKKFPVQMMNQGTTFFLPFRSQAFTNASLSATFAENGVLTSAGYEQKRAPGEAFAGMLGTLLDETGQTISAAREDNKTELELLQEQTQLAEAEKKLADAQAALVEKEVDPNDEAIEALQAETALLEAEVANINAAITKVEANQRLAEAQAAQ